MPRSRARPPPIRAGIHTAVVRGGRCGRWRRSWPTRATPVGRCGTGSAPTSTWSTRLIARWAISRCSGGTCPRTGSSRVIPRIRGWSARPTSSPPRTPPRPAARPDQPRAGICWPACPGHGHSSCASGEPPDPAPGRGMRDPGPLRRLPDPAPPASHFRDHRADRLGHIQPPGQHERRQRPGSNIAKEHDRRRARDAQIVRPSTPVKAFTSVSKSRTSAAPIRWNISSACRSKSSACAAWP
jgi:hypothetical protein